MIIKYLYYSLAMTILTLWLLVSSCNSAEKQGENAEGTMESNNDQLGTGRDSIGEYNAYKSEVEQKIAENKTRIDQLREEMKAKKKDTRETYKAQIDTLEQRNNELRMQIINYNIASSKERWNEFKKELDRDLDSLGESIRDLVRDNDNKQ
jgi:chromosome segregation ATPase